MEQNLERKPASEMIDELVELDSGQILQLLASRHLGRFVFAHDSWPVVLPVNYVFEEPNIIIRTGPGAKLAEAPFHATAFEIDDADAEGTWGWSVLVQGPAFEITYARDAHSRHLRELVGQPSVPGVRDHWLMISALRISGRAFGHPLGLPGPTPS